MLYHAHNLVDCIVGLDVFYDLSSSIKNILAHFKLNRLIKEATVLISSVKFYLKSTNEPNGLILTQQIAKDKSESH